VGHDEDVVVRQPGRQRGGQQLTEIVAGADLGQPADGLDVERQLRPRR
jgi:hypothetical protein